MPRYMVERSFPEGLQIDVSNGNHAAVERGTAAALALALEVQDPWASSLTGAGEPEYTIGCHPD